MINLIKAVVFSVLALHGGARAADPAATPEAQKMIGFHVDMNMALYREEYLKHWLTELAGLGYNTIVWELEDGVRWETVPEARQPDSLTKDKFRDVLAHARELGLENIPLLQTLGHAEYVLQHEQYRHLRANPDETSQYDPFHPEVVPLLHRWIGEYLDLFGEVRHFHIGADEARQLDFVQKSDRNTQGLTVSQIFMRHVNAVSKPLTDRGVTPIIWADMVLHHHDAMDELSRDVMMFDWMYDVWRERKRVFIWGDDRGLRSRDQLTPENLKLFGKYLFPNGDAPGVEPETFYSADFLADKGFRVVTCPGSSSYGDNVFSPRHDYHLHNTWDSADKGLGTPTLSGAVLTSWSVHLHPWELQHAQIAAGGYRARHPEDSLDGFRAWYVQHAFGLNDARFWEAADLLSKACLFTYTRSLGFTKSCLPVPKDQVSIVLDKVVADGELEEEIDRARRRSEDYARSLELFNAIRRDAQRGEEDLALWDLAARNLVNRAVAAELLLLSRTEGHDPAVYRDKARAVLAEMRNLHAEYDAVYTPMVQPSRRALMIGYMFDAVETGLARLAE